MDSILESFVDKKVDSIVKKENKTSFQLFLISNIVESLHLIHFFWFSFQKIFRSFDWISRQRIRKLITNWK